jgi:hypothetical protein
MEPLRAVPQAKSLAGNATRMIYGRTNYTILDNLEDATFKKKTHGALQISAGIRVRNLMLSLSAPIFRLSWPRSTISLS